ncbi:hypothetical protein ACQ4PT_005079 [Festuca glaucescens]
MCKGKRRCLICKREFHVARQCTAPVAGAVAVGAPPPPSRSGVVPPQPQVTQAPPAPAPRPPPPPAQPRAGPSSELAPAREPVGPHRIPAHQRLGFGGDVGAAAGRQGADRPSIKERLGVWEQGVASEARGRDVVAPASEMPFERGLRRERDIRVASPRRPEDVAAGDSLYDSVLRREQVLHDAALSSMVCAAEVEAARPTAERCIIYRTAEVDAAERALWWGLVAFVSGRRRSVSCAVASAAVLERFPELEGRFSVHRFWPADLLFVFDSRASRDVVLSANPFDGRDFSLRVPTSSPAGNPGSSGGPDDGQDGAVPGHGWEDGRGGSASRGGQLHGAAGACGQAAQPRRWRGGPERRVALG